MKRFSGTRRWLAGAALAVLAVAIFGGPAVPLYDGVAFPDEPYRYVAVPPSQQPPAPVAVTASHDYALGQNIYGVYVNSVEQGAQIYVYIDFARLVLPHGAKKLTLQAVPLAPTVQPADGPIAGNVYQVTAITDAGAATLTGTGGISTHNIDLRLPQGYPATAAIEYKPANGTWRKILTNRVGNDVYEASFVGFGEYALAIPTAGNTGAKHSRTFPYTWAAALAAVLFSMAAVVAAIRAKERKKRR